MTRSSDAKNNRFHTRSLAYRIQLNLTNVVSSDVIDVESSDEWVIPYCPFRVMITWLTQYSGLAVMDEDDT